MFWSKVTETGYKARKIDFAGQQLHNHHHHTKEAIRGTIFALRWDFLLTHPHVSRIGLIQLLLALIIASYAVHKTLECLQRHETNTFKIRSPQKWLIFMNDIWMIRRRKCGASRGTYFKCLYFQLIKIFIKSEWMIKSTTW